MDQYDSGYGGGKWWHNLHRRKIEFRVYVSIELKLNETLGTAGKMILVVNVNLNWWNVCIFCAVVCACHRCDRLTDSGDMHICFDFELTVSDACFFVRLLYLSFWRRLPAAALHCITIIHVRVRHIYSSMPQPIDRQSHKVHFVAVCERVCARVLGCNNIIVSRPPRQMNEQMNATYWAKSHIL